jgi:hypothetical protein
MRRPELVLAAAVVICLPMVPGILDGAITPEAALLRGLVALLACWTGARLLLAVLGRYLEQSRRAELARMMDAEAPAEPGHSGPAEVR